MAPTELPGATGDTVLTWEVLSGLYICFYVLKIFLKNLKFFIS